MVIVALTLPSGLRGRRGATGNRTRLRDAERPNGAESTYPKLPKLPQE